MCEHSTVNFLAKTLFPVRKKSRRWWATLRWNPSGWPRSRLRKTHPHRAMVAGTFLFFDPAIKFDSTPNRFRFTWTAFHPPKEHAQGCNSWKNHRLR